MRTAKRTTAPSAELPDDSLNKLLAISAEVTGQADLEKALSGFVVQAAEFLGFRRCFIALREGEACQVRWAAEGGALRPLQLELRTRLTQRVFASRQPFWTNDAPQSPDADLATAQFEARQYLLAPMLGVEGETLGMFAVLDRLDGSGITEEDVSRARALAAQAALVLEATQNLRLARRHQAHSDNLTSLAHELSSSFRLPDFLRNLTARVGAMLGARISLLALAQGRLLEVASYHAPGEPPDRNLMRRLNSALTDFAASRPQSVASASAPDLLGTPMASTLGWTDLSVARLTGP
ncbi:MAG: GAF domain-containing protein, partial [Acidobacteria bacterium]|nr:GAF domain-containing protein [Acidobacteriota bacterium]